VKQYLGGGIYLAAGGLLGLMSAVMAVDRLGAAAPVAGSAWTSWSDGSGSGLTFYANAHYLLGGRLPPAPAQVEEFSATRDSGGTALDSRCTYVVEGKMAGLPWWSLATGSTGGTAARIAGLIDSSSAVVESDGLLRVTLAPAPRAGNWIATPPERSFELLFTAVAGGARGPHAAAPPLAITRSSC
jgi:hypothetical protein